MGRILFAILALIFVNLSANAETEYSVEGDEFSSGKTHQIMIFTEDTSYAALLLACHSGEKLVAQLSTKKTIFPDDLKDQGMKLNVTMKANEASEAAQTVWHMNMGDYEKAWLFGEQFQSLLAQMRSGDLLSLKLDKAGKIYRFPISEAQKHLDKVVTACS